MNISLTTIISIILPAILTIIGNIIFYIWIKGKVDKSIEKHKIAYTGVFKERLDIYKELLKQIFEIKLSIQQYQYSGDQEKGKIIMFDINKFITYYLINQPFLSSKIIIELKKIREEFQSVFDDFYLHHSILKERDVESETRNELLKKFFEAGNKLKRNDPFKQLEDAIINEMRTDLSIDKL